MALNIKNERTHRLVQELAALRGVSMVAAVTEAVEEKLEREKAARNSGESSGLAEWILKLSRETAPLMAGDPRTSAELIEDLYDPETGLPR